VALTCVAERNSHLYNSLLNFGKSACICAFAKLSPQQILPTAHSLQGLVANVTVTG
jgi:hypothetical protein